MAKLFEKQSAGQNRWIDFKKLKTDNRLLFYRLSVLSDLGANQISIKLVVCFGNRLRKKAVIK
jgi:hypothetical protein